MKDKNNNNEEINTENEDSNGNPFAPKEDVESDSENSPEENNDFEKLKSDYDNLQNQYLRLAADFDNYRKRQQQEREQLLQYGTQEALKKMIDVLDNFDRAAQSCENVEDASKIRECFSVLEKH